MKQPMQPVIIDDNGTPRFHKNAIVEMLLDAGLFDMNQIAKLPFSPEDRTQFAQLIGYSVGGFGELSYVPDQECAVAEEMASSLMESQNEKG